eukprot:4759983-Pleurochrysis_carterae.AAC.1
MCSCDRKRLSRARLCRILQVATGFCDSLRRDSLHRDSLHRETLGKKAQAGRFSVDSLTDQS